MTARADANIASGLTEMVRQRPDALAAIAPAGRDRAWGAKHQHLTFRQLDRISDHAAAGLLAKGIKPGMRTVLMVKPGLSFFALTFGLFKMGAVPVLVDPGLGIKNLGRCLAEADPGGFVGVPQAQVARKLLGWGRKSIRATTTISRGWPSGWLDIYELDYVHESKFAFPEPVEPDDTAAILFTSGSTGVPKGAVYTHAIFHAQIDLLRRTYAICPGEVDLCTFPLFALFGPILGMTCVVPEMDATRPGSVDPKKIIEAIDDFGVTNLFGSPALIRRVGEYGKKEGIRLPSLQRVISAGAPVPASVLETFSGLLQRGVQIFTPYGATESLPVCSIGSDEILGETRHATANGQGVCVGRPVEGMRVELIAIRDEPIPTWSDDLIIADGEAGEIVVRGPVVTRSYFNRPEATALAKIEDPRKDRFWHRMGDLGRRDELGRIWFLGRKAHRVQTASGTLLTIPVEGIFNTHPAVARTALVGVRDSGKTKPIRAEGSSDLAGSLSPQERVGVRVPARPKASEKSLNLGFDRPETPLTPDPSPGGRGEADDSTSGSPRRQPGKKKPVLCVEVDRTLGWDDAKDWPRLRAELLTLAKTNPITSMIETFLLHPSFPVDIRHNAKIFREKLAVWAERQLR